MNCEFQKYNSVTAKLPISYLLFNYLFFLHLYGSKKWKMIKDTEQFNHLKLQMRLKHFIYKLIFFNRLKLLFNSDFKTIV